LATENTNMVKENLSEFKKALRQKTQHSVCVKAYADMPFTPRRYSL